MIAKSQLTTFFLLLVIGYIIYNISQPASNDSMNNVQEQVEQLVEQPDEQTVDEQPVEQLLEDKENIQVPELDSSELTGISNDNSGASLDNAFTGAVPPDTVTDQVDFNKNNVTEYNSSQFLPKEVNDEWFDTDFTKAKYNLNDDKMINTNRYIIGVNTVGQSLKNPSYDIRGTIPNPKYTVSPWMNSTYEPDNNLKPLC